MHKFQVTNFHLQHPKPVDDAYLLKEMSQVRRSLPDAWGKKIYQRQQRACPYTPDQTSNPQPPPETHGSRRCQDQISASHMALNERGQEVELVASKRAWARPSSQIHGLQLRL